MLEELLPHVGFFFLFIQNISHRTHQDNNFIIERERIFNNDKMFREKKKR